MQGLVRRSVCLAMGCAAIVARAEAAVEGPQLHFSPHVGTAIWATSDVSLEEDVLFGARLGVSPNPWFGLEGSFDVTPTHVVGDANLLERVSHLGVGAFFNFAPYRSFSPYFSFGWSQLHFDPSSSGERTFPGWETGLGCRWRLSSAKGTQVNLRLDARNVMTTMEQGFLAVSGSDRLQHNLFLAVGLEFALGGQDADGDADGVADRSDRCPTTKPRALVHADGCEIDSDLDGVADGLDACAQTPAGARIDALGCPMDSDADGIADGIDQCEGTLVGAHIDRLGCPIDSDTDGIADGLDGCAGTADGVLVDANGCPIVQNAREQQLLDTGSLNLENVYFESGKSQLKPISFTALEELGEILTRWPQLRIEIGGHTDSHGDEVGNQRVSEARAQAVFDYLARRFPEIRMGQFSVRGYGETRTIANNDTPVGRARNRRVEFTVLNREVLTR